MKTFLIIIAFMVGAAAGAIYYRWQHEQKLQKMVYGSFREMQDGYSEAMLHMTHHDLLESLAGVAIYATNQPHEIDITHVSRAFLAMKVEQHLSEGEIDKANEELDKAIQDFRSTYSTNKNYGLLWQTPAKRLFESINE